MYIQTWQSWKVCQLLQKHSWVPIMRRHMVHAVLKMAGQRHALCVVLSVHLMRLDVCMAWMIFWTQLSHCLPPMMTQAPAALKSQVLSSIFHHHHVMTVMMTLCENTNSTLLDLINSLTHSICYLLKDFSFLHNGNTF